jgi:hypothetical protein
MTDRERTASRLHGTARTRTGKALLLCLLLSLELLPRPAVGDGFVSAEPAKVEAAFLRNFAHYVAWPSHAFADDKAPWRVCILGNDPFDGVLDAILQGRVEQGRSFVVKRVDTVAELRSCHLAYIAFRTAETRRAALAELASRPILTVGDAPDFLEEGGIIRFQVSDHVGFGVDLDHANSASLKIPTKMLEVAQEVVENGVIRRHR